MMICAAVAANAFAQAQTGAPTPMKAQPTPAICKQGGEPHYIRPETAQQRKDRLGTAEDPGPDPDPNKSFWRFGKAFHIEGFDRQYASYDNTEVGAVKPFAYINVQKEIYQQNEKCVWVWMAEPTEEPETSDQHPTGTPLRYTPENVAYYKGMRSEFFETAPKDNNVVVRFEESSEGLPTSGSWRNSGTVADMNGDGCPDLIVPPERGGQGIPAIFLGDCKGHWKYWADVKWPRALDYGSVVAADFNKDGHMDLAFAVHLNGVYVFLGDGKGHFTESSEGLPRGFPTRRVLIQDVDGDGWPDVVAISEGPSSARQNMAALLPGRIRVFLNREKGTKWETLVVAGQELQVAGDWLAAGNFNGDKTPDFVAASIYYHGTDTVLLSDGPKHWKSVSNEQNKLIPHMSYYFANTAGHFSSTKRDDAIVSFARFWPTDLDEDLVPTPPAKVIVGIDRISFTDGVAKRTPIVRWGGTRGVWGLASGDFNHDGKLDFMYTRYDPREAVLMLGDGKGGFTRAKVEGITLPPNTNYDLLVADVNNDGLPDVILMYESGTKGAFAQRDGSIHVFLNRGVVKSDSGLKATAK